jgi:hypothetical protein
MAHPRYSRRNFLSFAASVATVLAAIGSTACSMPAFAAGSVVDVQLVDRGNSAPLRTWQHRGASWVAGRPGDRYAVRLTNRSNARVLVVLSVDGVNVISGDTASVGQTGYVLGAYETADITGWRKNFNEAAAFYFTALPDSYAARTDRPDNVGVIGAAVFREKVADRSRQSDAAPSSLASPSPAPLQAPSDSLAKREDRLGTGHGEREYSPLSQTAFERATERPAEVVKLRYDSYENLVASGVVQPRRPQFAPDPFPNSSGSVPDPHG